MTDKALGSAVDVIRSEVPELSQYRDYQPYLRRDFFYACAYCTMSEAEATRIRFTIDHYSPQKNFPKLVSVYSNLLYCCEECNTRKGARELSEQVKALGYRLFRPDWDNRNEHFSNTDLRVDGKTRIGEYTVDAVALNRYSLRRLREFRRRLTNGEEFVSGGVLGLRKFPLDALPKEIKGRAFNAVSKAIATARDAADEIDDLLRAASRSPLDGEMTPEEVADNRERLKRLKKIEALHPDSWRTK